MEQGEAMRRVAFLSAVLAAASASAGHFYLEITLRDGTCVRGYVAEKDAAFEGVARDGQTVRTRLAKLPAHAKREWAEEIAWDAKRGVFVLRAPWWTGELTRIWKVLVLEPRPPAPRGGDAATRDLDDALDEEKRIRVKGSDVATAKIRYVDPKTEVIKPKKGRGR